MKLPPGQCVIGFTFIQRMHFAALGKVRTNSRMSAKQIKRFCALGEAAEGMMKMAMTELNFSARAYDRILKVARTIADLAGSEEIAAEHIYDELKNQWGWAGYVTQKLAPCRLHGQPDRAALPLDRLGELPTDGSRLPARKIVEDARLYIPPPLAGRDLETWQEGVAFFAGWHVRLDPKKAGDRAMWHFVPGSSADRSSIGAWPFNWWNGKGRFPICLSPQGCVTRSRR